MKYLSSLLAVVLIIVGGFWFANDWLHFFEPAVVPGEVVERGVSVPLASEEVPFVVEEVASGLRVPWSIVFTSSERMLVTERPGRLRVIVKGVLLEEPLRVFPEISTGGEEGLMSLALHPKYDSNKFVYVSSAYENQQGMFVKVVRFRDDGNALSDERVIIDQIPAAQYHAGCRIAFGPDGKLYITTGDATNRPIAQDLSSLGGKILRVNDDGTIPADNPFPGSPIWSYGHRNPQGIAWTSDGQLYSSEHGPSVFDGPAGGDEVNHILKGANYGWPLISHNERKEGTVAPLIVFTPAEAPGSLLAYSGKVFPQFKNNLFFGALVGEGLMRLVLDDRDPDSILRYEKLAAVTYGRIREVMEGPDGFIYFSTSNRDSRGSPAASDDRIFRLVPQR